MSNSGQKDLGNWQSSIDKLWNDACQCADMSDFSKFTSSTERLRFIRNKRYLREIPWLQSYLKSCNYLERKSTDKAKQLRNKGNKLFEKKDFKGAFNLYSESLLVSPSIPSTEMALGFGNRSAVLFHQHKFELCIKDIEMAFQCGFPEFKKQKLHQRKGMCLQKLGKLKAAKEEFLKVLECIELEENVDEKRRDEIKDWLEKTERYETVAPDSDPNDGIQLPELYHGSNPLLPQASVGIKLCINHEQGRFLVASRPLSEGDTLLIERPFAAVLLPDHYTTHCHHCFDKLSCIYPCCCCSEVRYCSPECQRSSWKGYHQFECPYLDILHSIGIAHLSVRTLLVAGLAQIRETKQKLEEERTMTDGSRIPGTDLSGVYNTDYWSVYNLMPHSDNMVPDDLFQYALTAALLGEILIKSHFIKAKDFSSSFNSDSDTTENKLIPTEAIKGNSVEGIDGLAKATCDINLSEDSPVPEVTMDEFDFLCGILLRHIQQLVCNAHAITELQTLESKDSVTVETSQVRVATAIYPIASLMNHSCDPTIISSFYKSTLIVRAVKNVKGGEQIFTCYGPHCKRMSLRERQESLQGQYFFTCKCEACVQGEYQDQIFQAFQCINCKGPVCREGNKLSCRQCGQTRENADDAVKIQQAQTLYIEGLQLVELGNPKGALNKLESCHALQRELLYHNNRDLAQTEDSLARCWAMLGNSKKAVKFLESSLNTTKLIYGERSVEVGHELSKLASILFNDHQVAKALTFINESYNILQKHYGENHPTVTELLEMKQCLLSLSS